MKQQQTSITVSGILADHIRTLVEEFPGANVNRVGRAIVRIGLRHAIRERMLLIAELRAIDTPWTPSREVDTFDEGNLGHVAAAEERRQ